MMQLFYDTRDDAIHESRGSRILYWLDDLGAAPLSEAKCDDVGFLFAGARTLDDYRQLVAKYPLLRDQPEERQVLLNLDTTLAALTRAKLVIPTPRTWRLALDAALPADLTYPLFVRTALSSLKRGGEVSKVHTPGELQTEIELLRRALGWDALILARAWCDLAEAGRCVYGAVPQEVRTWIVDGQPHAWSFHYLNVVADPTGFPLSTEDLVILQSLAARVGSVFTSRLIAADFARNTRGEWIFIEAGPGSCAGTAHEQVFKAVASKLVGKQFNFVGNKTGGLFHAASN